MTRRPRRNHGPVFKAKVGTAAIKREQMSIRMRQTVLRLIMFFVPTIVVGLTAITIFGCGSGETPSQVVDEYYRLIQEQDCQRIRELVIDADPQLADEKVNFCEQEGDKLISYSIKRETIGGPPFGKNAAAVVTEVTIKENAGEETNTVNLFLVKRGDDWKLAESENRR